MTEYELLQIIGFLERIRRPFDQLVPAAEADQNWNLALFLMRRHLRGQPVKLSTLAQAAEVPFASAMRRIHKLIELGIFEQQERGPRAKTFFIVPSPRMVEAFVQYARKVQPLLTEGASPEAEAEAEAQAETEDDSRNYIRFGNL